MKPIYLAIAYRWGWLNNHSYFVAIGHDGRKITLEAESECRGRGGKYGVRVLKFTKPEGVYEEVAYFPSTYGEESAYENHRIGMFENVGLEIITHFEHKKKILSKTAILKSIRSAMKRQKFYEEIEKKIKEGKPK